MFKLTGYMDDERTAMLRCECGKVKTITYSNLSIHYSKYCILKDSVKLACPYCGRKQTDRYIPLEPQTIREEYLTPANSKLPYWMTRELTTEELLRAITFD